MDVCFALRQAGTALLAIVNGGDMIDVRRHKPFEASAHLARLRAVLGDVRANLHGHSGSRYNQ